MKKLARNEGGYPLLQEIFLYSPRPHKHQKELIIGSYGLLTLNMSKLALLRPDVLKQLWMMC